MEHLLRGRAIQAVAIQFVRTVGVVQFAEEQRQAVVGPGHAAVAVLEFQFADLAGRQFLHVQGVDLFTAGVEAVGQALVVGADAERAEGEETAIGQHVRVQQQLLAAVIHLVAVVGRATAAVVTGVLVTGGGAGVVEIRAPGRGQGQIGFENAALDLLEQGFAQRLLVGELGFLPGVFGLKVVEHLGAVTLLQPGVRIWAWGLAGNRGSDIGMDYSLSGGRWQALQPRHAKPLS